MCEQYKRKCIRKNLYNRTMTIRATLNCYHLYPNKLHTNNEKLYVTVFARTDDFRNDHFKQSAEMRDF